MADFLGPQQPPTKKFRSGTNSNESDFDFKMISQFDTSDTNNTQDLFDMTNDFNDPIDNTQSQQTSTSTNQQTNLYQPTQQRVNYIPQPRPQLSSYQTPSLQRIPTMPTSTIVRPTNVISNGIQQQQTIYTQQQMMNTSRPVYPRMSTSQQQSSNIPSTLVRQPYNTSGMVSMNQNVTQMSIVKASDPNNNSVFVTNTQQPSTLVGLQPQHTVTQTAQTNKTISTGLPSLTQQQLNQFQIQQQQQQQSQIHMPQQNSLQSYNIRVCYI
ncbi:unnamed protein product [Rotaria sp. Silwood2]|nr:unnamed protein product [Rotaria sp. Silwood2]